MDPSSSPYIIPNNSPHNSFPHSLLRTRQFWTGVGQAGLLLAYPPSGARGGAEEVWFLKGFSRICIRVPIKVSIRAYKGVYQGFHKLGFTAWGFAIFGLRGLGFLG